MMKINVNMLKPFADVVGAREFEVDIDGSTIEDLVTHLVGVYPGLKEEMFEDDGEMTDYIVIFLNDKPIGAVGGMGAEMGEGDEVLFFVPVSGG